MMGNCFMCMYFRLTYRHYTGPLMFIQVTRIIYIATQKKTKLNYMIVQQVANYMYALYATAT